MKTKKLIISIILAVILSLSCTLPAFAQRTEGLSGNGRVADEDTMDTYMDRLLGGGEKGSSHNDTETEKTGSRYAGRIWADKSVFPFGQDNGDDYKNNALNLNMQEDGINATIKNDEDFLHAFSALGSSQQINNEETAPLDVVILLDISTSMTDGTDDDALNKMLIDANALIEKLMGIYNYGSTKDKILVHPKNRIGVVVYGGGSQVVLPLDSYKKENNTPFLTGEEHQPGSGQHYFTKVTSNAVVKESDRKITQTNEYLYADSTYLQAALYQGMNLLATANDPSFEENGKTVTRTPVLITMTDGATNIVGATSTGDSTQKKIDWWDPLSWVNNDKENKAVVSTAGLGAYYTKPNLNPIYLPDSVTYNSESVSARSTAVLLTAGYMKNAVENHYNKKMQGFGIGLNLNKLGGNSKDAKEVQLAQLYTTLNPKEYVKNEVNVNNKYKKEIQETYTLLSNYCKNDGTSPKEEFRAGQGWVSGIVQSATWTFDHPSGDSISNSNGNKEFDINSIEDTYYIDQYMEGSSENLDEIFGQIFETITNSPFNPLEGTNSLGAKDSITFMDPIGENMEVKGVDSFVLYGKKYDMVRTAKYSYSFNTTYLNNKGETNFENFESGWYYGEPEVLDDPKLDGNSNVVFGGTGAVPVKPESYKGDNSIFEGINNNPTKARSMGWNYYLNYKTASEFVPTIKQPDSAGDIEDKQKNTIYTFYKLAKDEDFNSDPIKNPVYENYPEIPDFKLTDIRIWVETTDDYDDDSEGTANSGFDDALFIDIPSQALPVQLATVTKYENGDEVTYDYKTNLGGDHKGEGNQNSYYAQSTPFRVFYKVGVKESIKLNGKIDTTKLSQEYLNKYKEENRVVFYSNYYSGTNCSHYELAEKHHGDPYISFSPSKENRYYSFQKPLPLYRIPIEEVVDNNRPEEFIVSDEQMETFGTNPKTPLKNGEKTYETVSYSATDETVSSDGWYYIVIDYYIPNNNSDGNGTGKLVHKAVARKGSEFGSEIGSGERGKYLCWYNIQEPHDTKEISDTPNANPNNYIAATKVNGLRVGNMASNLHEKKDNKTSTAGIYYYPSVSEQTGESIDDTRLNVYLGNNGKLTIEDSLISVTKQIDSMQNEGSNTSSNEKFKYQIYIDGFEGEKDAVVLSRNERGNWYRRLSYIDLILSNQLLLMTTSYCK